MIETFVDIIEADLRMIRMKYYLVTQFKSKIGQEWNSPEHRHVIHWYHGGHLLSKALATRSPNTTGGPTIMS